MFFYLSKILDFLWNPITWVFVLLVWGLLTKKSIRKKRLLISATVLLYVFSNGFILSEAMRLMEPDPVRNPEKKYKYGVVLGGMIAFNGELGRPAFYRSSDRLLQALTLYSTGKVEKLILSGGSGRLVEEERKESDLLKDYLVGIGIPAEDLLIENRSRNTRENALYTAGLLEQLAEESGKTTEPVLLITSAFHMPRSLAAFQKAGVEADPFPVDYYASRTRRFHPDHLLLPDAEVLFTWEILIHEWIGRIMYSVAGYT